MPLKPFAVPYVVAPRECRVQFPKPCFKGLKCGRWDCNVRGGAAESSVIRIACDLWVVRRVDRTAVFVCRPKGAAYHTWGCVRLVRVRFAALLDEAVVFVWVASAVESDISKDSIRQAEIAFSAQRSGQRL